MFVYGSLSHLRFNFCEDVNILIHKGGFTRTKDNIVRKTNNDAHANTFPKPGR